MRNIAAIAAIATSLVALGMQLDRSLSDPQPVVIYCQPVCEMP